ncbi:MAG: rhodanese-like domain-containing protein [Mycobacteriaceae bacterium]
MDGVSEPAVPAVPVSAVPAEAVVLDVREDDEWAAGHASGALHIPLSDVPARAGELPGGLVHVICRSGGRSARAVAWLNQNGHDATNIEGGTVEWAQQGRPMTAEGPDAPTVA